MIPKPRNLNAGILVMLFVVLLSGCGRPYKPVLSYAAHAKALSNDSISIKTYRLPKAHFRCVIWPLKDYQYFQIEAIVNGREKDLEIPAPPEFLETEERTEDWTFTISRGDNSRIVYFASRKDQSRLIEIELPKNRQYEFWVAKNLAGDEMLMFMDYSESAEGGLFGYVIIRSKL